MKRGIWHQFGDKSHRLVLEQEQSGNGIGVIISPRDLSFSGAIKISGEYRRVGSEVTIDLQFYNPVFHNKLIESYPINNLRISVSELCQIKKNQLSGLADSLRIINSNLGSTAILSPALVYEAGRNDLIDLNSRLFSIAKQVGDDLGIPTYATVFIGQSAAVSDDLVSSILSSASSLNSDGWYFGFEFTQNRIPFSYDDVFRFGSALLNLACTGKPVLHSYAGPLSLLSMAFGATGTAIGHSQNLWQFTRKRWESPKKKQGGGGNAPPRYFSKYLWGTFVYPDEFFQLPVSLRGKLLGPSPWSTRINNSIRIPWARWEANKHLVYIIGQTVSQISGHNNARECASMALDILDNAIHLIKDIEKTGVALRDDTCCYQSNWRDALNQSLQRNSSDYDYLDMLLP